MPRHDALPTPGPAPLPTRRPGRRSSPAPGGAFGRATALGFARAGARVCLSDIDPTALEETRALVAAEGQLHRRRGRRR